MRTYKPTGQAARLSDSSSSGASWLALRHPWPCPQRAAKQQTRTPTRVKQVGNQHEHARASAARRRRRMPGANGGCRVTGTMCGDPTNISAFGARLMSSAISRLSPQSGPMSHSPVALSTAAQTGDDLKNDMEWCVEVYTTAWCTALEPVSPCRLVEATRPRLRTRLIPVQHTWLLAAVT